MGWTYRKRCIRKIKKFITIIQQFRKKPVVISAVQLTLLNTEEVEFFVGGDMGRNDKGELVIATLEGAMICSIGDYIIKGVKGEFYPCKPDILALSYEKVKNL